MSDETTPERPSPPPTFPPPPPPPSPPGGSPSGRRRIALIAALTLVAAAAAGTGVGVMAGKASKSPEHRRLFEGENPPGSSSPSPSPDPRDEVREGEDYSFLYKRSDGDPVRWNPCEPVHYVVNVRSAPSNALGEVRDALGKVTEATGITFAYDGRTGEVPQPNRRPYLPDLYGKRWAPLLIAWAHQSQTRIPFGDPHKRSWALGVASPVFPMTGPRNIYVSGWVLINADAHLAPGFARLNAGGLVLQHELGHVMGLGHVHEKGELMDTVGGGAKGWGPGDLVALEGLGAEQGCLTPPPTPGAPPNWCAPPPSRSLDSLEGSLNAVDDSSEEDVWAVGDLVVHWNGESWETVDVPAPSGATFDDVLALAPDDVWIVGETPVTLDEDPAVLLHWNGTSWTAPEVSGLAGRDGALLSIAASGPEDVWVVGWSSPAGETDTPFAARWNGSTWQVLDVPNLGDNWRLLDASVLGPGDLWAVAGPVSPDQPVLVHWNGERWEKLEPPTSGGAELEAVAALAPGDVWVAGTNHISAIVMRWDGQEWSSTDVGESTSFVVSDLAGDPTGLWAVGERIESNGDTVPLVLHWDGERWNSLTSGVPHREPAVMNDLVLLPGGVPTAVGSVGGEGIFARPFVLAPC